MQTTLNNIIIMTRGDSLTYKPNPDTLQEFLSYKLSGDDAIYFGLMDPRQPFEEALVRKVYTVDDYESIEDFRIELNPEDTLDLIPGKYYYAIKLHIDHIEFDEVTHIATELDQVITLINKTKFILND